MSTKLDLHIGSQVLCEDQECGRLSKLVVDPHTHRITDLIVSKGILFQHDSVVPIDQVEKASQKTVVLSTPKDALGELTEYREKQYVAPPEGWGQDHFRNEYLLHRVTPASLSSTILLSPMIVHRVKEGVSPNKTVIRRGLAVEGLESRVGTVDHVLIDRETEKMRLLIVDRGMLKDDVVIPADHISSVTDGLIRVQLTDRQIEDFYHYAARSEVDILTEVRERLSRVPIDPDSIGVSINGGILHLTGVVPDIHVKRRIVGTVAVIEGVLYVEAALETADTIQARVVTALRSDPRTDIAGIDVIARGALVTLSGQVDSQEIKDVAQKIAAEQKGVVEVVNELEVKTDEQSPDLHTTWLAHTNFGQYVGTGSAPGISSL